jgi:uncharacterized protein (TIGR03435 family)
MNSPALIAVTNHLWQSTLFAALAASLTLLMRGNSARVRYLVWLSASIKFLVPFAVLTAIGRQIPWPAGPAHGADISSAGHAVVFIMQPGGPSGSVFDAAAHPASQGNVFLLVLTALWALGASTVGARWFVRWIALRRALRQSTEISLPFVIPARSCSSRLEPAVVGIFRPVLLLPEGLERRLVPEELHAVLTHERCHVVWRDNLAAALHMLVEALFWFYPLIWWLGARLVAERERACDEQVLAEGYAPASYAQGILKVCEHFLDARFPCACGVAGPSLKRRIEDIMKNRSIERLSDLKKAFIVMMASCTVVVPVAIGLLTAPRAHAQDASPGPGELAFSNVSIQLAPADGELSILSVGQDGRIDFQNATLRSLVAMAFDVHESQVTGRQWSEEPRYNITADGHQIVGRGSPGFKEKLRPMVRELLARYFGLIVKHEPRRMNGYVLSAGSKLKAGESRDGTPARVFVERSLGPLVEVAFAKRAHHTVTPDSLTHIITLYDGESFQGDTGSAGLRILHFLEHTVPLQVPPLPEGSFATARLMTVASNSGPTSNPRISPSSHEAINLPLRELLSTILDAPVNDETGQQGNYELSYDISWQSGSPRDPAVLVKSLEEQLGLHLEASLLDVDTIDVVSLKPTQEVVTVPR